MRALLLVLLSSLSGCRTTPPAPHAEPPPSAVVRPSLEEVFLEPPLFGTPPDLVSVAASGDWALYRWSPPTAQVLPGPDAVDPEDPEARLYLVAADGAAFRGSENGTQGLVVALGVVGPESEAAEWPAIQEHAWSHRGARLAAAVEGSVVLLDGDARRITELLRGIAPAPAEEDDGAAPDEEQEAPEIESLDFAPGDESLRIGVDGELYLLPLTSLPDGPLTLADLGHVSADVGPSARRLQWSDDLAVAFGDRDLLSAPSPEEDDQEDRDQEDSPRDPEDEEPRVEVWHVTEARGVTLEGMASADDVQEARLSPDGRFVFAALYDRTQQPEQTLVPDYLTERVTTKRTRRELADAVPAPWQAFVWNTADGTRAELFPAPDEAPTEKDPDGFAWRLQGIGWAPQKTLDAPARFALQRLSRDYRERELWVWSEAGLELVWRERDAGWIGGPASRPRWNADGSRLLVPSENGDPARPSRPAPVDGRCQLYSVDPAGGGSIRLTDFATELRRFAPLAGGGVLVEGAEEDPAESVLAFVSPASASGAFRPETRAYAAPAGRNTGARAASDGATVFFTHEELFRPAELWSAGFDTARELTACTPAAFDEVDWILPQRLSVRSEDGRTVFAHVYLPPGVTLAAPGPPRATIVFVHGAGYLQNVTDSMTRYPLNMLFHSRLARLGYPVVDVDYRGSAGYGRDFRTDVQYHLGGKDLDDIHAVLDELVGRGLVDGERVGIYGGSYGGFMALMALATAPERWAVGAALRSVTDWRTYYPGYTQPRLGRPSTHPEAYARSSPIDLVDGVEDPVLVLHGMVDTNVFAQDSIRFIEALIDRGREFDAMLYPSQGHAFDDGPHWLDEYRRIERYLTLHLGPPLSGAVR